MDWKTPTAFGAATALGVAIITPPVTTGEFCPADPPYRNQTCDTHTLVVTSTNTGTALTSSYMLGVVDNVAGELRQAPVPAAKFRQYIASNFPPTKRPS
jgi:hypothetical protein